MRKLNNQENKDAAVTATGKREERPLQIYQGKVLMPRKRNSPTAINTLGNKAVPLRMVRLVSLEKTCPHSKASVIRVAAVEVTRTVIRLQKSVFDPERPYCSHTVSGSLVRVLTLLFYLSLYPR